LAMSAYKTAMASEVFERVGYVEFNATWFRNPFSVAGKPAPQQINRRCAGEPPTKHADQHTDCHNQCDVFLNGG
jgi:hypothetical protein